jgi:putative ABC transport system permease protein
MTLLVRLRSWLRATLRRARTERDMDAELRFHIEAYAEDLVRTGVACEEALRRARVEFGGLEQAKEQCRDATGVNLVASVLQDVRYGFRQLRRTPGFTAVAVITLAFGIGANTAVFSILYAVLVRPLPFPNAERLVKAGVYDLKSGDFYGETSYPDFEDWRENHFFEHLAAYENKSFNLAGTLQPEHVKGTVVSSDFFETLGVLPWEGRSFATTQNRQAVVLSYSLWSRSFGSNPAAISKAITLDGYGYEVIGVMPPGFQFPDPETELWVLITPIRPDFREEITARGNLEMSVVGRLKPNAHTSQAQAEMTVIAGRLAEKYPNADRDLGARLVPLQEATVGKFRPALLILMGSAALVLLVACTNIATLLLARGAARLPEIAIRSSLGASRRRIIAQLLTESLLLAAIGGAFGALLASLLTDVLVAWAPTAVPRMSTAHVGPLMLLFTSLIAVLAGVLFGVAPAWQISRHQLNTFVSSAGRGTEAHRLTTKVMVAAEVALSLILLTAAGLLGKSLLLLSQVDPGFRTDHLLTVEVYRSMTDEGRDANWKNWTGFYQQLLARIQALPGVDSAAATLALPIEGHVWNVGFKIDSRASGNWNEQPQAEARIVSNNYFDVMKIPLRSGRYFSRQDTKDSPHVAVINESVARLYGPKDNPVGRFIEMPAFGAGHCQIIGIVGDTRQASLSEEPAPAIYVPYTQEIMPWQTLVVRTRNDPMSLAALIRHEVAVLDPQQPIARIVTLDALIDASTAQPRFRTFLLGGFAGIALLLCMIGIYGVVAYAVSRRTREIGVRMAVGASPGRILKLVLRQSMTMILPGVLFGLLGALAVTRLMKSLLFGVTGNDPGIFAGVTLLLCSVALLATYVPARRAAQIDPMVALHHE